MTNEKQTGQYPKGAVVGTHSPKIINAQIKQEAICARIVSELPIHFISSQTVSGREVWGMPLNAANIKTAKEQAEAAEFSENLPNFQDGNMKQILLPYFNSYIAAAPVCSAKVMNKVHNLLSEKPNKYHNLQPNFAAWANHGEQILEQKGRQRLFMTRTRQAQKTFRLPENVVCLSFRCESMNISGGMLAVGTPAITAIGGMVHSWERDFGAEIRFALGLSWLKWIEYPKKGTNYQRGATKQQKTQTKIISDEICGNGEIKLLIKSEKSGLSDFVRTKARELNRFSGGTVWDLQVLENQEIQAIFLIEQNEKIQSGIEKYALISGANALQIAVQLYETPETWGYNHSSRTTYSINNIGYAFLENPIARNKARNGYLSAWAEPIFSAIALTDSPEKSPFWRRVEIENAVWWQNEHE